MTGPSEGVPLLLLIEDDVQMRRFLRASLHAEGFRLLEAETGEQGIELARSHTPDVILLDLGLPDLDGIQVTERLRGWTRVPIIVISARGRETDKVEALDAGADDYLTKPFEPEELLARVEALLRRVKKEGMARVKTFHFGSVDVDFERSDVRKNGAAVNLAGKELELLRYLVDHRGSVVSREELLEGVWQYQPGVSSRTIDVHVAWLRQKLEDAPQSPRHIHTVRGVGYRFAP
jgi:two-component system KDP operon response regulator KdpE